MSPPNAPGESRSGGRDCRTLLVAEDDDDFRATVRYWLAGDCGWEVREAADGREAVEKLDDAVDVLVLDRQMPGLSGPEVLDRLAETPFDGPVVVMSAYRPDSRLSEDDVTEYLTKPLDREEFVAPLESVRR